MTTRLSVTVAFDGASKMKKYHQKIEAETLSEAMEKLVNNLSHLAGDLKELDEKTNRRKTRKQ